ncbi:MAG: hypothetical protein KAS23_01455 [Anaerohalosphaera sp.]|nr:hypothetical protein [Anaerohalosphaera sp.]
MKAESINKIRKMNKLMMVGIFVMVAVFASAIAAADGTDQEVVTDEVVQTSGAEIKFDGAAIQSITFAKDMSIRDALRFLALKYQRNIVPTSQVDGMVTVTNLYNVTFEEALQAVIGVNKFEIQGNFIMVYTAEEYEQIKNDKRRMEYRLFELCYLTAEEAQKLVTPLKSVDGNIESSTPSKVGISQGDSVSIDEGGSDLALRDALVVKDYPENIADIDDLLKKLDVKPLQVLIEATILSATLNENMEFGVDLNFANGIRIDGGTHDDIITQVGGWDQSGNPLETVGFATAGGSGLKVGVTAGDVAAFITAVETVTDVTVLANPKVLALNKQVGTVFIGQKLGYRSSTSLSSEGVATEGTVEFLNSGTKLSFRPYIADDGYIRMDIYPKDSSAVLNDDGVPTETTAELTTNIMVKDGQTVVIGGLFRDDISATRSQVPLFGDIPFLGSLFRGTDDTNVRQEVIILLTPHIIENLDELESDKRVADIGRKRESAVKELQMFSRTRLAEDGYAKAVKLYSDGNLCEALRQVNCALRLRPSYYEASWLRERILLESGTEEKDIERIMIDIVEQEQTNSWIRL